MTRECCLQLDYSRQDSLERRASSLESPKSSQEGDHSKGSKDTLDDDTPPEPLERDYPHQHPQPPPRSSLKLQQTRGKPSQTDVIRQQQQQPPQQQQQQQTKDVGVQDRAGVRHSHSSPPNTLFAQASLEVSAHWRKGKEFPRTVFLNLARILIRIPGRYESSEERKKRNAMKTMSTVLAYVYVYVSSFLPNACFWGAAACFCLILTVLPRVNSTTVSSASSIPNTEAWRRRRTSVRTENMFPDSQMDCGCSRYAI